MKKNLSLFAVLFSFILAMQASTPLLQRVNARAKVSDAPVAFQAAVKSADSVAAIIELESEPVAEHARSFSSLARRDRRVDFQSPEALQYEAQLDREQADFQSRAALISPNLQLRTRIKTLANAISIEAPANDIAAIAALPGVKRVELVKEMRAMLDTSVPLIGAPAMWERLGGSNVAGEGMKIAILDTGIDISNPLFSDAGFTAPAGFPKFNNSSQPLTNNKVIVAKSFLSGNQTAIDENGHGTNVAGIAAGNLNTVSPLGQISGVAPRAYLGNYRVLNASGGGTNDLIAKAITEAVNDGFDVLNMSFGTLDPPTESGFIEEVVENAVKQGAVIVIAAGNNETDALVGKPMTIRSPAIAPSAITVAATSNSHIAGTNIIAALDVAGADSSALTAIKSVIGSGVSAAGSLSTSLGPLPCVDAGTLNGQVRGCGSIPSGSLNGKIALIERGDCLFSVKVNNAANVGAKAVIIYNRDASEVADGGENLFPFGVDGTGIPSVFIKRSTGIALRDWLQSHPGAQISITPQPIGEVSIPADVITTFSALGPSVIEGLKPDISAPGLNIYSGAIKQGNARNVVDPTGFLTISGTSQASPHVAGAAALVLQLHPTWTPAQVKSALMTSASTDVFTTVAKSARAGVLAQGAGRVDLARATSVTATFSSASGTGSISFGINKLKKKALALSQDFVITNVDGGQNTFTFSVQPLDPGDGVVASITTPLSVQLAPGETRTGRLAIAAAKSSEKRDYTGLVNVTDSTGQTFHVPYWVRFVKKK